MNGWDLLVDRADLTRTTLKPFDPQAALAEGEALLEVESFALTANNITYGAVGDRIGYWRFFPAPEGQGRIPVWGFARVVRSRNPDTPEGLRLFGYWPMSSHTVARFSRRPSGYVEVSEHRAELPPTYNSYQAAEPDAADDWRALLQPLVMTSFLIDDQLSDTQLSCLVLSSASSKTAMGLAWFARQRGVKVIGLTSPAHVDLLKETGLYDGVVPYDQIAALNVSGTAAYVDFAGRGEVNQAVHEAIGEALKISLVVGVTHWEAIGGPPPTKGPGMAFFFAPDRVRQRIADWGADELQRRAGNGLREFVAGNPWLKLRQHVGADALQSLYADVVAGRMNPDEGHIVRPR
jgi:hypothetical protein